MLKLPALTPEEQRVRDMIWEREMEITEREGKELDGRIEELMEEQKKLKGKGVDSIVQAQGRDVGKDDYD